MIFFEKKALLLLLSSLSFFYCFSQDIVLNSQADVEAVNNSMTVVGGDLIITNLSTSDPITDLSNLENLNSIEGKLSIIGNQYITSLSGLQNLISIGDIVTIGYNDALVDINALGNITWIRDLRIFNNPVLLNLDGLINLISIDVSMSISENNSLINLNGLSNLMSIGGSIFISNNSVLSNCCGLKPILSNFDAIGYGINFEGNAVGCVTATEVTLGLCLFMDISINPPCLDTANGSIWIQMLDSTPPFSYVWQRLEDGQTESGNSNESNFAVENLSSGTYNLFVTDATGAEYIQENILLIAASSFPFEFKEITITNSSNGFHNGIIEVNLTGGIPPYSIRWSGASLGIVTELQDSTFAIDQLRQGEYEITASDNAGHQRKTSISLSHDNIPIPPCDRPLDIVILNDVSGSVTSLEYDDSKQYFLEFLQNINIGIGSEDNRAAIIEWSHTSEQSVQIPMTGDLSILQDYLNFDRVFNGANDVDDALLYGKNYLNDVARPGAERVIVFATDVTSSEITPSFAVLAGELKSAGYHLVTVVFDESYGNPYLRELFREVASDDLLAFSALSFSQLDQNLAEVLVSLYMCPISSGNLATSFFGRDGAINILSIEQRNPCIDSHYIQITIEIEAAQQLHIPIGTPITFYDSNPVTSEVAPVFVWELPCQIPAGVMEIFTVTLPVTETDDIFAVFNDDGIQSTPLVFPVTNTEEVKYSNNLASIIDYELPQPTVATEDVTLSVCQGETIVYNNMLLAAGDTQEFIFQSYSGCDSTVTVSVVEHPNNNEVLDLEVCPGEVVYFDGVELYIGEERTFVFTNTNGCDSTIIVKVLEKKGLDELISPNAFSPNGDGINDCFQPYIADNDLFYSYQLHIYDRWGELIFKTIDPNDCWDGSINDYAGSSGTYVWFVEITTEGCRNLIVSHGDVVLLR